MNQSELKSEARKCIEIQSHLSSCLYNWAAAHTFYEQEVICWSTTAAYYSVIHGIRTLFSLIEFVLDQRRRKNLKKILKIHRTLCLFLLGSSSSEREIELRRLCINCFASIFADTDWDFFLRSLGEKLSVMKEARENENYEHFVIAHHGREYHIVFNSVNLIFQKTEEIANSMNPTILNYVAKYYDTISALKHHHLWHLKDELLWLQKTLQKEKLNASTHMEEFIDSLDMMVTDVTMPENYHSFEREMDQERYDEKKTIYRKFSKIANAYRDLGPIG